MVTPLLTTKLYMPRIRPELVQRPHLLEQLNAGLERKLTIISAPAGFGKTTLLSQWVGSCGRPVAWLTLDEGDNDPTRFLAYLVAALQSIEPDIGNGALRDLQSPQQPSAEAILTALVNQINAARDTDDTARRPLLLVLDDYHLITAQPIHDALTFLLDHLPDNMHLVIATRADPPLPLPRLRARGQLTELRQTALRFSPEEASAFLNQVMGLDLSADDTAALASRTEGWIAGLQMAAFSMRGREDAAAFIRAFAGSNRHILDYLVEEVLDRQPEGIQAFLLQTSILDRMSGPLCDAVIGVGESLRLRPADPLTRLPSDSQVILEQLERANLFIVPLDDRRDWYRYHRLFADLLRKRLHQLQPDQVPTLHHRASAWYEGAGLIAEAIDQALSARDFERAADLIEQIAEETLMRSEVTTLLSWIETLSDELVRARPRLCVYHAWALLLDGRPLDTVESRLRDVDDDADFLSGKAAPLRAFVAIFRGHIPRAAELARQALERLPKEDSFLRSVATWSLGFSYLISGDVAAGSQALDHLARMSQEAGNVMVAVMTLCNLAELHMAQGQNDQAREIYRRAVDLATEQQGRPLPIAGMALIGLGELSREANDLETATHYLTEGIERIQQWGGIGTIDGYISLARVRQAQGDVGGAREAIQCAQQVAEQFDATDVDDLVVAIHQVRLWIAQGNIEAALRWAEERGLDPTVDLAGLEEGDSVFEYHLRKRECLTLARLLIAQGRPDEALAVLESLLAMAEQGKGYGFRRMIEIQMLRALAFYAQGNVAQALTALERALSLAEPGGYVRTFLDEGPPMARLLYEAAARGIAPEYTGRLLAVFPAPEPVLRSREAPDQMVEPLSERELEVLQLIAEGLSNQQIAVRLMLSLPTVKWHAGNIYGKLGVRSRTQAVAQARALGILPAG